MCLVLFVVRKIDFKKIVYVNLILIKNKLKLKGFMFWYIRGISIVLETVGITALIKVWWLFALIFFAKGIVMQTALQRWDMRLMTLFGSTFYLLLCWQTLWGTDTGFPISDFFSFVCFFSIYFFLSVFFIILRALA